MNSPKLCLLILSFFLLIEQAGSKRGGINIGRSRGSSSARISSSRNTGGTVFGSRGTSGSRGTAGGWNTNRGSQGGWNTNRGSQGGWNTNRGGTSNWRPQPRTSKFSKSGIGSFVRSNSFKNAIVGAAAGYLTYQAGKAIIRNIAAPMMWNNRPYYWGSQYYPPGRGYDNMCRMPLDPSDPVLGNVYTSDGVSRPKSIVWSCNYDEYCCGYECCRGGGSSSNWGFGIGSAIVLLLGLSCGIFVCYKCFQKRSAFLRPSWPSNKFGNAASSAQYAPGYPQSGYQPYPVQPGYS